MTSMMKDWQAHTYDPYDERLASTRDLFSSVCSTLRLVYLLGILSVSL